jgi:hypothetical protein
MHWGGSASPPRPPSPPSLPKVTCEALLQFLLAAIGPLYGGPAGQPVIALRLLLACAYVASEEARLEQLSYTFFEEVRRTDGRTESATVQAADRREVALPFLCSVFSALARFGVPKVSIVHCRDAVRTATILPTP